MLVLCVSVIYDKSYFLKNLCNQLCSNDFKELCPVLIGQQ